MSAYRAVLYFVLISIPFTAFAVDLDNDGIDDAEDNCYEVANPGQCDDDNDGIGNFCDADLDNDCSINSFDLSIMRQSFGTTGPHAADLTCDGVVNSFDLARMRELYDLQKLGPSAFASPCIACNELPVEIPLRWSEAPRSGEIVDGSFQETQACPDGATMNVTAQALIPGNAYTMWFGFFENPDNCHFPPRTPANPTPEPDIRCGFFDLFNSSADPNMRYGDGKIATGVNDTFSTYVGTGVPPGGTPVCFGDEVDNDVHGVRCQSPKLGWSLRDDHTGILTNPMGAEFQAVLKSHGPEHPDHPDQTTTMMGGCGPGEPNEPCTDPQVAGAGSELYVECFDPRCVHGPVISVGYPFVAGEGSGPVTGSEDQKFFLRIAAVRKGDIVDGFSINGSFTFIHTGPDGEELGRVEGEICALDVSPSYRALALGRSDPQLTAPDIALTIEDISLGDEIRVNVPSITGVPIVGSCGSNPVVDAGLFSATVSDGNFWVAD